MANYTTEQRKGAGNKDIGDHLYREEVDGLVAGTLGREVSDEAILSGLFSYGQEIKGMILREYLNLRSQGYLREILAELKRLNGACLPDVPEDLEISETEEKKKKLGRPKKDATAGV